MAKQRRWFWVGIVVALVGVVASAPLASAEKPRVPTLQAADGGAGLGREWTIAKGNSPIFMAGGMQGVWLCIPRNISREKDTPANYFELWYHARGATEKGKEAWLRATYASGPYTGGVPRSLASLPGMVERDGRMREVPGAWVLFDDVWLQSFSIENARDKEELRKDQAFPAERTLKGVSIAAGSGPVFVLAHGPKPGAATQAASAPASGPNSAPASAPAAPRWWQIISHHDRDAENLSELGQAGAPDGSTPSENAEPVLVATPGRLLVAWREPTDARKLHVRTLSTRIPKPAATTTSGPATATAPAKLPEWSPVQVLDVGEDISRLTGTTVDGRAVLAWAAKGEAKQFDLHGMVVGSDGTIQQDKDGKAVQGPMFPMKLGEMSDGVDPRTDIAMAPSGTALCVVVVGADKKLRSRMFPGDSPGPAGEAQEIEPSTGMGNDADIVQRIMFYLLITLVAVSLWQWRMRPKKVSIPRGHVLAPLGKRVIAAAIDLAIPLFAVVMYESLVRGGEGLELLKAWFVGFVQPAKIYAEFPILLFAMGGFLLHVTVGEIASGRSIGKSIVGTRVVSIDGMPARGVSIFLRNFVKVFELTTGVLLVYVLISEHRQRLGDLLAQTIVIEPGTPQEPGDNPRKRDRERDEAGTK